MTQKFTVEWLENKQTKTGKPFKIVSLKDESGKVTEGVSAFDFKFPALDTLTPGATIEGEIQIDGTYKNLMSELKPPAFAQKGSAFKEKVMNEAMARKETSIAKSQDNKEYGIKVASTMNKAVELAIAENGQDADNQRYKDSILMWREWLWNNWDVTDNQYPPFNEPKEDKF